KRLSTRTTPAGLFVAMPGTSFPPNHFNAKISSSTNPSASTILKNSPPPPEALSLARSSVFSRSRCNGRSTLTPSPAAGRSTAGVAGGVEAVGGATEEAPEDTTGDAAGGWPAGGALETPCAAANPASSITSSPMAVAPRAKWKPPAFIYQFPTPEVRLCPFFAHALHDFIDAHAEIVVQHQHLATRHQPSVHKHIHRIAGELVQLHHRSLPQLQHILNQHVRPPQLDFDIQLHIPQQVD